MRSFVAALLCGVAAGASVSILGDVIESTEGEEIINVGDGQNVTASHNATESKEIEEEEIVHVGFMHFVPADATGQKLQDALETDGLLKGKGVCTSPYLWEDSTRARKYIYESYIAFSCRDLQWEKTYSSKPL